MKKMLALLLALFLPLTAAAETYGFEASVTVNEAAAIEWFAPRLTEILPVDMKISAKNLVTAVARVCNGLGLRVSAQDAASCVEFLMGGKLLVDSTVWTEEENYILTCGLHPDHMLVYPIEETPDDVIVSLSEAAFVEACEHAARTLAEWFSGLDCTITPEDPETAGGITTVRTWYIVEREVADLVDALLTVETRSLLESLLTSFVDAKTLWAYVDSAAEKARTTSSYAYMIITHEDAQGKLQAVQFAIKDGQRLLLTAALNRMEDKILFDVGYGAGAQNRWISAELTLDDSVAGTTRIVGPVAMLTSAPGADDETAEVVSVTSVLFDLTEKEEAFSWAYTFATERYGESSSFLPAKQTVTGSGSIDLTANMTFSLTENCAYDGKDLYGIRASCGPVKPIAPRKDDLIPCEPLDMSPEMQELYNEVQQAMQVNVTVRLMKLLPLDVIMNIPNLLNLP